MSPYTYPHRFSSDAESRLLHFSHGGGETKAGSEVRVSEKHVAGLESKIAEKKQTEAQENADPKAAEQEKSRRLEDLVRSTNETLGKYQESLKEFPPSVQMRLQNEIGAFFESTISTFEKDGVPGFSKSEYEEFKQYSMAHLNELLSKIAPAVDTAKKQQEKAEREVDQKKHEAELALKSLEQVQQELTQSDIPVPELQQLEGQPENVEAVQRAMQTYAGNVDKVHEFQSALQKKAGLITDLQKKGQEEMKLLSDTANTVSASAAVASGAAVGAAIGVWGFGIGAVIGAGVGATIGAISYGIGKGAYAEAIFKEKQQKADAINRVIDTERNAFNIASLEHTLLSEGTVAKQGALLNAAPEALRTTQSQELGTKRTELAKTQSEVQGALETRTQKKAELTSGLNQLAENRRALEERAELQKEQQVKTVETVDTRLSEIDAAITAIEKALTGASESGQQQELEGRLVELRRARGELTDAGIAARSDEAVRETGEKIDAVAEQDQKSRGAIVELSNSITGLEGDQGKLGEHAEGLDQTERAEDASLNALNTQIGEDVLESTVLASKGTAGLIAERKHLSDLKVEPESFMSAKSSGFDGFGHACKFVFKDVIGATLEKWSKALKDIPVLNITIAPTLDLASGITEGVGELGEGVAMLVGHPFDTLGGLGALIGRDPNTGKFSSDTAGTTWKELGKALIAYKEFSEGNVNKGLGKVALNVLLTATGGGAAAKGVSATRMAYIASRAASGTVLRSTLRAAGTGVRIAGREFVSGAVKNSKELFVGAGKVLKFPGSVVRNRVIGKAAVLEEQAAQLGKVTAELTHEVAEAGKAFPELAGKTSSQLAEISKDGAELVKLKITDTASIRKFQAYKTLVEESEHAQHALTATKHAQELRSIDEVLDGSKLRNGLTDVAGKRNPKKLQTFIEEYNAKTPPNPENAFRILEETREGGLVAFDKNGALTSIPSAQVRSFLQEAVTDSARVTGGKPLLRVLDNADAARVRAAKGLLGNMTAAQEQRLLRVHRMKGGLKEKLLELKKENFTAQELLELKKLDPEKAAKFRADHGVFMTNDADAMLRTGLAGDSAVIEAELSIGKTARSLEQAGRPDRLKSAAGAREIVGTNAASSFEKALVARTPKQLKQDIAKLLDEKRLATKQLNGDELKEAMAEIAKLETQQKYVQSILSNKQNKMKLTRGPDGAIRIDETYQGIRDLKKLGLNVGEQRMLAEKLLQNSGTTIEELINVGSTLPDEWLAKQKLTKIASGDAPMSAVKSSAKFPDKYALQGMCKGDKPLEALQRSIGKLDQQSQTILKALHDDLQRLSGVPLDDAEKTLILRESMEYLHDYQQALATGGDAVFGGKRVSAQQMLDLLRENQNKLAHQTIFDRKYLTGSDHGVLHVIEADMRWGTQLADDMIAKGRMTHEQKVLLRQATIDHDMGYAFNPLDGIEKGIGEGSKSYFAATKDHPLYSSLLFDSQQEKYTRYFGKKNVKDMKGVVLDHSDATNKATLGAAKGKELIAAILAEVDCLGVSADFKMMKLFKQPEMVGDLLAAYDTVTELKGLQTQLAALSKDAKLNTAPCIKLERKIAEVQTNLATIKQNMQGIVRKIFGNTEYEESFLSSLDKFFDPLNADFPAIRDLGSHSLSFDGIRVGESGRAVARFNTNAVFEAVSAKDPKIASAAIKKVVEDFGYRISDDAIDGIVFDLRAGKEVRFTGGKADIIFSRGRGEMIKSSEALGKVVNREIAFEKAIAVLEKGGSDASIYRALDTLAATLKDYVLENGGNIDAFLKEIGRQARVNPERARQLLQELRFKGHGKLERKAAETVPHESHGRRNGARDLLPFGEARAEMNAERAAEKFKEVLIEKPKEAAHTGHAVHGHGEEDAHGADASSKNDQVAEDAEHPHIQQKNSHQS